MNFSSVLCARFDRRGFFRLVQRRLQMGISRVGAKEVKMDI
jgi:hypothetical protein